jgi:hypothetical protein
MTPMGILTTPSTFYNMVWNLLDEIECLFETFIAALPAALRDKPLQRA